MFDYIEKLIAAFSFLYFTSDYIFSNPRIKNIFSSMDSRANSVIRSFIQIDKKELLKILLERLRKFSIMSFVIAFLLIMVFKNETSFFILLLVLILLMFSAFVWFADYIIEYGMCSSKERFKKFFNRDTVYFCITPVLMYLILVTIDYPDKMPFIGNEKELQFLKKVHPFTAYVTISGMGFFAFCFLPYALSQMFVLPVFKLMILILHVFSKLIIMIEEHMNKNIFRAILAIVNLVIIING